MTVEAGEIVGIMGPNGSGKSTFFNLLTHIEKPTAGSFVFKGEDISRQPPHRIAARGVARTFQTLRLFTAMTCLENVMVGQHVRQRTSLFGAAFRPPAVAAGERRVRQTAERLLEEVGLGAKRDALAANLSYGQQKRLELARALSSDPDLLLLDEPTAGMNDSQALDVLELVRAAQRQRGLAVLIVEHNIRALLGLASRVAVFDAGLKIAEGSSDAVRKDPQVIAAYLGDEP